jgi:hypothetical protein
VTGLQLRIGAILLEDRYIALVRGRIFIQVVPIGTKVSSAFH